MTKTQGLFQSNNSDTFGVLFVVIAGEGGKDPFPGPACIAVAPEAVVVGVGFRTDPHQARPPQSEGEVAKNTLGWVKLSLSSFPFPRTRGVVVWR